MEIKDQGYAQNCKQFIETVGRKQIINDCDISLQTLNYWLNEGIPKAWFKFLCEKYKTESRKFFEIKEA